MKKINILYIEDNEGDVLLLKKQLGKIDNFEFNLDNVSNYNNFLQKIDKNDNFNKPYDLYFIDYNLSGAKTGLDLVDDFQAHNINGPFILLTGVDSADLHTASSDKGIYDYLLKSEVTPSLLKRVITHSIARHLDFQDKIQREKSDHQNQKMQALGILASGVAHEINNLIQPIFLACELLQPDAEINLTVKKAKDIIFKNASRSSEIANNILSFSRMDEGSLQSDKLSEAVLESLDFMDHLLPEKITVEHRGFEKDSGYKVMINRSGLSHILTNIMINASQAMDKQGVITVSLDQIEPNAVTVEKFSLDKDKSYVSLSIQDHGCGVEEEIKDKVFDPFFTTKETGEGTGLGLSIVYSIIKKWGGAVQLDSKKGEGTTFTFFFKII